MGASLMQRYLKFIVRARKHGEHLASYGCPCCAFKIETAIPATGQQYDTLVTCPKCRALHFRVLKNLPEHIHIVIYPTTKARAASIL